ncbi:MAG TPA: YqeG family HAD IIIA-type phosphatase [Armatimonadota bacterium]|nr:YqeG family HAD IIIA-type phosphatase [Armatimonadota bacterium]
MHPWFKPKQYVATLRDVDPVALRDLGIHAVLLDLDNTLVAWRGSELQPDMEAWVRRALDANLKICIVSNTWRRSRIHAIAEKLGIPYILRAGKPRRGSLRRAMETLVSVPEETAVIGDQIFTDIMGGNRIGAYTILCAPMPGREFFGTGVVRQFERFLMRRLADQGHLVLPGRPAAEQEMGEERTIREAQEEVQEDRETRKTCKKTEQGSK